MSDKIAFVARGGTAFCDIQKRWWHIMEREEDGSIVIYYTREGDPTHWVVYDDLDTKTAILYTQQGEL